MSASVQKDRFTVIGIHMVPAGMAKRELELKVEGLADPLVAFPTVQKNTLSLDVIFQNDLLDASMKAGNSLQHSLTSSSQGSSKYVVRMCDFHFPFNIDPTMDNYLEIQRWRNCCRTPISLTTSLTPFIVVTRVDVPKPRRSLWVGIFKGPGRASATKFLEDLGTLITSLLKNRETIPEGAANQTS
ncbi:hypothetical protein K438DRAFT_1960762 [Mycena galopus ATCC 62051]|nr:hypothetical protein K438DRAFT_1960762 [Mycena galopus ATCC 62051]